MKDFQLIPKSQIFSREQLKAIRGGDDGYYGYGAGGQCLYCRTSGGDECWYRAHPSGYDLDECAKIYHGVQIASASWGSCDSTCHMN